MMKSACGTKADVMISATDLRDAFKRQPDRVATALGKSLREFGYCITDDLVEAEMRHQTAGGKRRDNGPSIFIEGWLRDGVD